MNLEPRALREHVYCDKRIADLEHLLRVEAHHNAVLVCELSTIRAEASQAAREREEALVEVTRLLNLLVATAVTEPARALNGIVA